MRDACPLVCGLCGTNSTSLIDSTTLQSTTASATTHASTRVQLSRTTCAGHVTVGTLLYYDRTGELAQLPLDVQLLAGDWFETQLQVGTLKVDCAAIYFNPPALLVTTFLSPSKGNSCRSVATSHSTAVLYHKEEAELTFSTLTLQPSLFGNSTCFHNNSDQPGPLSTTTVPSTESGSDGASAVDSSENSTGSIVWIALLIIVAIAVILVAVVAFTRRPPAEADNNSSPNIAIPFSPNPNEKAPRTRILEVHGTSDTEGTYDVPSVSSTIYGQADPNGVSEKPADDANDESIYDVACGRRRFSANKDVNNAQEDDDMSTIYDLNTKSTLPEDIAAAVLPPGSALLEDAEIDAIYELSTQSLSAEDFLGANLADAVYNQRSPLPQADEMDAIYELQTGNVVSDHEDSVVGDMNCEYLESLDDETYSIPKRNPPQSRPPSLLQPQGAGGYRTSAAGAENGSDVNVLASLRRESLGNRSDSEDLYEYASPKMTAQDMSQDRYPEEKNEMYDADDIYDLASPKENQLVEQMEPSISNEEVVSDAARKRHLWSSKGRERPSLIGGALRMSEVPEESEDEKGSPPTTSVRDSPELETNINPRTLRPQRKPVNRYDMIEHLQSP